MNKEFAKEYLNIKEAAKIIGISHHTLYKWSVRGIVPSHKFGLRTLRFTLEDIEKISRKKEKNHE